ncbi:MAG: CDP-diacylglycerol--glycerol-3-phosphate 3-phosphatidyltransferase [Acidobacteriota bacterium]|nr:CDP-diacylglycerol--glycerol-3-phosphate 3-phosphatidyltransferase [Acidobacteriota bacterium]MDH3784231.1 CDP-diacylglycerol--glycerol-3-phosphate 3-phosphatidyltransferase [Acidobacteriota bacterium]
MRLNLPTTLTVIRIFLAPLLVVVLLTPPWATAWLVTRIEGLDGLRWLAGWVVWMAAWREIIAVLIFLVAAATDWLDGYLARRRREVTTLGKLLDPIADKLLTVSAFISLVELGLAPAWMIVVIVGREFAVSGMRSIAATRGMVIEASVWGKWKTVSQVVAITLLILTHSLERWVGYSQLGTVSLWIVMVLALLSMWHYFLGFIRQIDLREE